MPRSCFKRNFPSSFLPGKSSHPNYSLTRCGWSQKKHNPRSPPKPLLYIHFPEGFPVRVASLLPRKVSLRDDTSSLETCRRRTARWPRNRKGRRPTARGRGPEPTVPRSLCHHFTFGTRGIRPWQIQGTKPTKQLVVETAIPV